MKDVDLSIVFKLRTVEDLGDFYKALKQTMTLQEQHALDKKIRKLKEQEKVMNDTLKRLKDEIHKLDPEEKLALGEEELKEADDEAMPEPERPSEDDLETVPASDERFIVEETEETMEERESEDNVQGNLEA